MSDGISDGHRYQDAGSLWASKQTKPPTQYHDEAVRLVAEALAVHEATIRTSQALAVKFLLRECERRLEAEAISADLLTALKAVLAGKPVRCADELIAAAERFLEGK